MVAMLDYRRVSLKKTQTLRLSDDPFKRDPKLHLWWLTHLKTNSKFAPETGRGWKTIQSFPF